MKLNMIRALLLGSTFFAAIESSRATDYTWTAVGSAAWSPGSWSPAGPPGSSDNIVSQSGIGALTLNTSPIINNLTRAGAAGSWSILPSASARTFTVNGDLNVNTGALILRGNASTTTLGVTLGDAASDSVSVAVGTYLGLGARNGSPSANDALSSLNVASGVTINGTMEVWAASSSNATFGAVTNNGTFSLYRAVLGAATATVDIATLNGTGTTQVSPDSNSLSATLRFTGNGTAGTYSGALGNGGNNVLNITKIGSGTQALTGLNTNTGVTTISAGVLSVSSLANGGAASGLGASSNAAANLILNGGTLRYTGGNSSMDRNFTLTASTDSSIDVSNASTNLTISGGAASTLGGLTKVGSGTLTFTGANLHSGNTTVAAGTLVLSGNGSIANSAIIRIASGAALNTDGVTGGFKLQSGQRIENKGAFGGSLTALGGSTYALGNGTGIATQNGDLALDSGSAFEWGLTSNTSSGAGTNFSQTQFTSGGLTIQSGVAANLIFNTASTVDWTNSFWSSNQQWLVFDGATSLSDVPDIFDTINVGDDSLGASLSSVRSGASFSFTSSGNDVFLTYTAVPEPTTWVLFASAMAFLFVYRKRPGTEGENRQLLGF